MRLRVGVAFLVVALALAVLFSSPSYAGQITTLVNLSQSPRSALTLVGSRLYGTTHNGGTYGTGTVFTYDITPVPEPATLPLLMACVAVAALLGVRSFRKVV